MCFLTGGLVSSSQTTLCAYWNWNMKYYYELLVLIILTDGWRNVDKCECVGWFPYMNCLVLPLGRPRSRGDPVTMDTTGAQTLTSKYLSLQKKEQGLLGECLF